MTEPRRDLDAAFAHVADEWDAQRTERTLVGLRQKQTAAKRVRSAAVVSAIAAISVLGVVSWRARPSASSGEQGTSGAAVAEAARMTLADGSRVFLHDAHTRVSVREETDTQVALELQAGEARFDVRHREERVFRVIAGDVSVLVLGTEFEVERAEARTRVAVLRGRVAVIWPGGRSELAAGEAGWFPREEDEEGDDAPLSAAKGGRRLQVQGHAGARSAPPLAAARGKREANPASRLTAEPTAESKPPKAQHGARRAETDSQATTWREPAEQGDFDRAYEMLRHAPQPSPDDVEELLLAADTARLSGHPAAALPFLKQVIDGHSQDSRAPLAAFTLGGLLMQQLSQPREAEAAYARARALSLNSSLAEDALARQVEAAHRAGDASRARALAEEYLSRYPSGRRVHAVQRFGGM